MKLAQICEIHSGYTARSGLEQRLVGGIQALQLGDIGSADPEVLPDCRRYDLSEIAPRYLIRGREVVFRSRGQPNCAIAVESILPEPIAIISPLVILRPDYRIILPEYLAWLINHPASQRILDVEAQGTSIRMIPISVLERLRIVVRDLSMQRRIIELDRLRRREGRLLHELAARRKLLVDAAMAKVAMAAEQKEIA